MFWLLPVLSSLALAQEAPQPAAAPQYEYRVLATSKTSTMQKEMNAAAAEGFAFASAMGGESAFGGKEVIVVMLKDPAAPPASKKYVLLATSKTSTMQKEMSQAAAEGFRYRGQTVFESAFGGREVAVIMERDAAGADRFEYRLLATSKTSTMQKELQQAGRDGFRLLNLSVGETAFGGNEVLCVMERTARP